MRAVAPLTAAHSPARLRAMMVTVLGGDFSGATLNGMLVITFDPNNGDQPSTQKVNWSKDGAALTAPDPVPTNEGHSIEGWYYDNNGTGTKWNFDTDTVKCTMTLKAKWELSTYSVTLQTDGGTIASGKEVTGYTYGTGAVLPTTNDITREGYALTAGTQTATFPVHPSQRSQVPIRKIKRSTQNGRRTRLPSSPETRSIISWSTTRRTAAATRWRKQNIPQGRQVIPSQRRRKPMKALPTIRQSPPPAER